MRLLKIYSLLLILFLSLGGCELVTPETDFHTTFDRIYEYRTRNMLKGY